MTSFDVCVRGAGPVGSTLALALSRQGLRVALAFREPAVQACDVRAYALNAASRGLLQSLRVWDALPSDSFTPVHDIEVEGDRPGSRLAFTSWTQGVEVLAWIVDAGALDQVLAQAIQYAPHVQRVAAPGESGTMPAAALTCYCEGKDSQARRGLGVQWNERAYGQRAIAARLQSDSPHLDTARQWFRSPDVLALLPFDRPAKGHSYALVWSLPQDKATELAAMEKAQFEAELMQATGRRAGQLTLASPRAVWPLMLAQADPVVGPGWALLGDAAHVVHPLAGQGLNLGLADVGALSRVIAGRETWRGVGDEILLRRYARERAGPTWAMEQVTDSLLHLFAHPSPLARELRNLGLGLVDGLRPLKRLLVGQALRR